jgi:hypothetical protein
MSDDASRRRLDRLKDWWWAFGIVTFLAGSVGGGATVGFAKFTVYYLAEQSSITTLQALNNSSKLTIGRLETIDSTLREQQYTDRTVASALKELAEHVHELDGRADNDRTKITDALAVQSKNSEQILLLLEPKGTRK